MDRLDARNEADLRQMRQTAMIEEAIGKSKAGEDLLLRFDASKEAFHFTKHHIFQIKAASKSEGGQPGKGVASNPRGEVYFDELTNKLVVREKEKSNTGFKRKAKDVLDGIGSDDEDEDDEPKKAGPGKKQATGKSTKEEETLAAKVLKRYNMQKKQDNVHFIRESGEMYRAKGQTKGDVAIPGKAAPHAFVQLNPMVAIFSIRPCRRRIEKKPQRSSAISSTGRRPGS
jgi:hypothetical protein